MSEVTLRPGLSDEQLLASLEEKRKLIRDRVKGVARGYANGFYLFGEGGISKSYTVEQTLRDLGKAYKVSNSQITGKGCFTLLRDFPDCIHIWEDVETLFHDERSLGVLRSAMWGQADENGRQDRSITWQTAKGREEFTFSGGLIVISNRPLANGPAANAFKTRIAYLQFQLNSEEIAAHMRAIARQGFNCSSGELSADSCLEVAAEIISRTARLKRNLDLRLFVNTCSDRLQWENGDAETHWKDLLDSRMKERTVQPSGKYETRKDRKARELDIIKSIAKLPRSARFAEWRKQTGTSEKAMYRRMNEVRAISGPF